MKKISIVALLLAVLIVPAFTAQSQSRHPKINQDALRQARAVSSQHHKLLRKLARLVPEGQGGRFYNAGIAAPTEALIEAIASVKAGGNLDAIFTTLTNAPRQYYYMGYLYQRFLPSTDGRVSEASDSATCAAQAAVWEEACNDALATVNSQYCHDRAELYYCQCYDQAYNDLLCIVLELDNVL